uniref:Prolyl 4-hydroxylase alpha subunit domain-containing protein n=1 Tax=Peronospora matthiolae TaxID=2874970 RepID=A0AAV1TZF3_9STRA
MVKDEAADVTSRVSSRSPDNVKSGAAKPLLAHKKSSGISSSRWPVLSAAVVLLAVGCATYVDVPRVVQNLQSFVGTHVFSAGNATSGAGNVSTDIVPDKYTTDLVAIQVRHIVSDLTCNDSDYSASTLFDGRVVSVTEPMEAEQPMAEDRVFFMLNGANKGVYVSWNGQFDCLGQAAEVAAAWLGADRDVMVNGVRLYSQLGWPVRNADELHDTKNIVHVLLDFQLWQWPGIKNGYKYVLENGVTLTTVGISPKVFDVQYFITQEEADQVIEIGSPLLNRSMVSGTNTTRVESSSRTSHTAFLPDSIFTRDFQKRSALVARLPSPSYVEHLQLVRYGAGEFYRQHFDTFYSREFLPEGADMYKYEDYVEWTVWAAEKLRGMDQNKVPEKFREGGPLFPNANDSIVFPQALLGMFRDHMNTTNQFKALFDTGYDDWIRTCLESGAEIVMKDLVEDKQRPSYLPLIVQTWEEQLGLGELRYTFPKHDTNSVSHFFHWVRWAKERVSFLGDKVPAAARPGGKLYPEFTVQFQEMLLGFILDDYSRGFVVRMTNKEWYDWMVFNRGRNNVLFKVLQAFPQSAELAIRTWESRIGGVPELHYKLPDYVQHFQPQRFVTLFLYLNNQTKVGGETVFPFSLDRYSDEPIVRDGMDECSSGLAVPPLALHASLFYVQTPEGVPDVMSRHGGCPPSEGVKWGANSFMWDSDSEEGAELWTTK